MEWRLIFSGLQSPYWTASVVVAVLTAIFLFLTLRRYEARLVPRHISFMLLSLRVMVLLLLLVTLMQPVLTREATSEEQGRLIVGVDVSESMDTADKHASPAEMLRWAQALGMLGNAESRQQIEEWITAYEAGEQPDFAATNATLKRHVDGVFEELREMPRVEFVRRLLQAQPNNLLSKLTSDQVVELHAFGSESQAIKPEELTELSETVRDAVKPAGTNLAGVLRGAIGGQQPSEKLNAIVLFTDGRHTSQQGAAAEAERMGGLGIPVHCVPVGSLRSPRDLAVASVDVPQTVFLDDDVRVRATVSAVGFSGDEVTVRLLKDGNEIDQRTVTVAGEFFDAEFAIPATEAGSFDYSIDTRVQEGELREDNNEREFSVSVVDEKTKVWLIDGTARWEFRYLNSALERDQQVELSTVLFKQPSLGMLNRTFLNRSLPTNNAELTEKLANTDILILGDVNPLQLSKNFWNEVDDAVANEGLTLLIIPGKEHMPHDFSAEELTRLLPVTAPRQQLAERYRRTLPDSKASVFRLEPTVTGREQALLQLSDPDSPDENPLSTLPGHPWAYTGMPKPAASVWATLSMPGENLDELPVIVHQFYGFGQVVWMGVDSTWRWRFRAGDKWHHRFWGQAVRWAARNKSAAGNDQVRLTLSDVVAAEGDPVDVSVRWDPRVMNQLQNASVEVVAQPLADIAEDDAEDVSQVADVNLKLKQDENAQERFSGRLPDLPPGRYKINLKVSGTQLNLKEQVSSDLLITQRLSSELSNVSCNREFLSEIANASEGQILEPWKLQDLPDLVRQQPVSNEEIQEQTLWDHWLWMLLFFLLLTFEWILRKRHGLP